MSDTKQSILYASLDLFSKFGYSSVSMEQIAEAVGIKAPSLYKHFRGKQDIFDSIFTLMDEKYAAQIEKMHMHLKDAEADLEIFRSITEEDLYRKVTELVSYSLHDEYNSRFRKLLTTHQFSDSAIAHIYNDRYTDMLLKYHTQLFSKMVEAGVLITGDIEMMALQYVAPIYTLIAVCEREPERETACMEHIRRHIHQFNMVYRTDGRH